MRAPAVVEMPPSDREWLRSQVGLPLAESARLVGQIEAWLAESVRELGMDMGSIAPQDVRGFARRMLDCWAWHWGNAGGAGRANGEAVARRVREGRDPVTGKPLGGDPFRDVVLAEGVVREIPAALSRFAAEYRPLCLWLVRDVTGDECPGQAWWDYLLAWLRGPAEKPGPLSKYLGRCGLEPFLRMSVRNRLRDLSREPRSSKLLPGPLPSEDLRDPRPSPADSLVSAECRERLLGLIRRGLTELGEQERRLVLMRLEQGLSANAVAEALQIKPESVTQSLSRAVRKLRRWLEGPLAEGGEYSECLALLGLTREPDPRRRTSP